MSINSPANQHTSDEREQKCWDFYVESVLKGTPNAYESAIKSGYSEDHSRNITIQGWFKERLDKLRRRDMLSKAEKKLDKTLDYEPVDDEGRIKVDLLRVQTDVAKHITSTLGKNEGYSTRNEVTGKDGGIIETTSTEEISKLAQSLNELTRSNNRTSESSDGTSSDVMDKEVSN